MRQEGQNIWSPHRSNAQVVYVENNKIPKLLFSGFLLLQQIGYRDVRGADVFDRRPDMTINIDLVRLQMVKFLRFYHEINGQGQELFG